MNLAEKVKHIRKIELKLTQQEFAKLLGVSRSYISEIEQNRIIGNINLITKLSEISNKPVAYFADSSVSDVKIHSYEVLDNIINSLIENNIIDNEGNMDVETEKFLLKTLKAEIDLKLNNRR